MASSNQNVMLCLECGYRIDHLESVHCPECGRGFNPHDPQTYRTSHPSMLKRTLVVVVALPAWMILYSLLVNLQLAVIGLWHLTDAVWINIGDKRLFTVGPRDASVSDLHTSTSIVLLVQYGLLGVLSLLTTIVVVRALFRRL